MVTVHACVFWKVYDTLLLYFKYYNETKDLGIKFIHIVESYLFYNTDHTQIKSYILLVSYVMANCWNN